MTNKQELFNTTKSAIQEIETELHYVDKGIFFAPELYIAFRIGLNIYKNRKNIFKGDKVEWLRETSFAKGSIADIAFKVDGKNCVFELKIRSTGPSYESDINKLRALTGVDEKYFIALVDCFVNGEDGRLPVLENSVVADSRFKAIIPTSYSPYNTPVNCEVHLLQV